MDGHQRQAGIGQFGQQVVHRVHGRDAHVGFVDAVILDGLRVGDARERRGDVVSGHLADFLHHGLDHGEDGRLLRIAHLDIDLSELRLAVGAQVFIAEAAHDLEILFEPADHQELLEDLRRLRQRVERAGLHAAGHQVIARAFRRGARHERGFDFEEAQVGELLAYGEGNFRAQDDVALHLRAAQIHVAVLQARVLRDIDVLFHGERRRFGFVENPDLGGHHLHLAGGHIGIDGFLGAEGDDALDGDHVLGAHLFGALVNRGVHVLMEDGLRVTGAVAHIDEDHRAVIAAAVRPSHQKDRLARI